MNDYKITLSKEYQAEYLKADRIEYTDLGFILFYVGSEIIATVNNPLSVVKKPADSE